MQKSCGERLNVNLACEGMKGGPKVLKVLQVLQVPGVLNDPNMGQHLALSRPLGFNFAQHRPKDRYADPIPPQPVLRLRRPLHPRISSGGILRNQADRGETWTFHSPGTGTG